MLGYGAECTRFFPQVCYLFNEVLPLCLNSRFDTEDYGFPFFDEDMTATDIWYTSPYGPRALTGRKHYGIDLGCDEGTPIHAAADGIVRAAGYDSEWDGANGALCLQHITGKTYTRYLHCSEFLVSAGERVVRGQVIARTGNVATFTTGPHLHFEIGIGDAMGPGTQSSDPAEYYPYFFTVVGVGEQLLPA